MPGYENAPATRLVATSCCCCGRPLLDARSAEIGIGPDCREKYGFNEEVPEAARVEANGLVFQIALDPAKDTVPAQIKRIDDLGLRKLAFKLAHTTGGPVIEELPERGSFLVKMPKAADDARFQQVVQVLRGVPGRRFDRERKGWVIRQSSRIELWKAMVTLFPGRAGSGPQGVFLIPNR